MRRVEVSIVDCLVLAGRSRSPAACVGWRPIQARSRYSQVADAVWLWMYGRGGRHSLVADVVVDVG